MTGESGVGKELIARRIHEQSPRSAGPFVKVDCASIPADVFESEPFGHVSGAVPGSLRDRASRIELADGGTLFLDEVGDILADLQAKLLRPLQDSTFERVGDDRIRRADVRAVGDQEDDQERQRAQGRARPNLVKNRIVPPLLTVFLHANLASSRACVAGCLKS